MDSSAEGFAVFKAMPQDTFRFRVEASSPGKIWLENKTSKKQWECVVDKISNFAPAGIAIPHETVLGYVKSCLKSSNGASPNTGFDAELSTAEKTNDDLVLQVTFNFELSGFSWKPTYKFPLKSLEVNEIDKLRSQLQDLRDELAQTTQRVAMLETTRYRY